MLGSGRTAILVPTERAPPLDDYAKEKNSSAIVRGLRSVSDFEYEFQMAQANRGMSGELDTVFLMTDAQHGHLSSTLIKEIHRLGGNVRDMVPEVVYNKMKERLGT